MNTKGMLAVIVAGILASAAGAAIGGDATGVYKRTTNDFRYMVVIQKGDTVVVTDDYVDNWGFDVGLGPIDSAGTTRINMNETFSRCVTDTRIDFNESGATLNYLATTTTEFGHSVNADCAVMYPLGGDRQFARIVSGSGGDVATGIYHASLPGIDTYLVTIQQGNQLLFTQNNFFPAPEPAQIFNYGYAELNGLEMNIPPFALMTGMCRIDATAHATDESFNTLVIHLGEATALVEGAACSIWSHQTLQYDRVF